MKKTAVAAALTALAVPAAAQADRPDKRGDGERANAGQKQDRREARKERRENRRSRVGFVVAGVKLENLTVTDGRISAFSLDLTAANKHARKLLGVDRAFIRGTESKQIPVVAGDEAKVRLRGITDGGDEGTTVELADVLPTDRVHVIGKARKTRTGEGEARTTTYSDLDIKKIVIKRRVARDDS